MVVEVHGGGGGAGAGALKVIGENSFFLGVVVGWRCCYFLNIGYNFVHGR